jgi:hypothetical protein
MLLNYLSRLKDERAYENARRVLHSASGVPSTEELMKSYAEELEEKGERRGRQSMLARAVLQVLAARSVYVDDQTRQRVLSCKSLKTLDRWLTQAARAITLSDVFGEPQQ